MPLDTCPAVFYCHLLAPEQGPGNDLSFALLGGKYPTATGFQPVRLGKPDRQEKSQWQATGILMF